MLGLIGQCRSIRRRKALKREPQERWELKKCFQGFSALRNRKEGSQTLNTELLKNRATFLRRNSGNKVVKKRATETANAVGPKSSSEEQRFKRPRST